MKTKAIALLVVLGVVRGLWAGVGASSAPFEFHAAGESLASDVSDDFDYRASGETLATQKSDAFGYRASGEAVVSAMAVESATYRAVGDVLAFGTSATFAFQAVGEAPVQTQSVALTPGKAVLRLSVNSLRARTLTVGTTLDVENLRFRYWEKLTDEPTYLTPTVVEVERDGTICLEVEMPPASSGFLQPVLAQ